MRRTSCTRLRRHTDPVTPVCLRNRVHDVLRTIQSRGQIGVVIAVDHAGDERHQENASVGQAAVLILSDSVRPGARTLVRELHRLGVRPVKMLTGDNKTTAERVASSLGLDDFAAELLPQDKLDAVAALKAQLAADPTRARHRGVAVIGDGVNDAPALAAADVSVAIGSIGSDAALETADIVLLSDDLGAVPWAVSLARRARATVRANLVFALGVIGVMGVLTLMGSLTGYRVPLGVGVLAHEGGTLLVVLNSLRLLWVPSPRLSASSAPEHRGARAGSGTRQPPQTASSGHAPVGLV